MKTKIDTEVAHVTYDPDTITFKVKRSKVNLQGAGAYCGGSRTACFSCFLVMHVVFLPGELLTVLLFLIVCFSSL